MIQCDIYWLEIFLSPTHSPSIDWSRIAQFKEIVDCIVIVNDILEKNEQNNFIVLPHPQKTLFIEMITSLPYAEINGPENWQSLSSYSHTRTRIHMINWVSSFFTKNYLKITFKLVCSFTYLIISIEHIHHLSFVVAVAICFVKSLAVELKKAKKWLELNQTKAKVSFTCEYEWICRQWDTLKRSDCNILCEYMIGLMGLIWHDCLLRFYCLLMYFKFIPNNQNGNWLTLDCVCVFVT